MKKRVISLISSNIIFFLFTAFLILGLNLTPLIAHIRHAPKGRSFALIHNNTQDFFFYQSLMNEGAVGDWLTTNPYTTEPHNQSFIFAYFLWLGKLSKLLGLTYALTYLSIRIILAAFLILASYFLILIIKLPYSKIALLFFLFAAPFMHKINDGGKLTTVPFMNWWTGMDPIRRVAYLPHHMFGALLLVITVILIIKYVNAHKMKYLIGTTLLTIPLAFVHPPSLFIILITLPVAVIIHRLTSKSTKKTKQQYQVSSIKYQVSNWVIGLLGYWLIGLFVLFFMVSQTNQGFPWSQYINWEKKLQFPLDRELFGALGILFPFAILGAVKAIASKRFHYILIACWLFVPLLLVPFASSLNISNIRLIQGVPYLPMAILAILGIGEIENFIRRNQKSKKIIVALLHYCIVALFIFFTLPTFIWSLKDQIREYWPIFGNVYLDNRLTHAFTFISRSFPAKTITLSTFYTGNYLPAFTHTRSFIGHFGYTYNIEEKQKQAQKFFENKMSIQEAKEFIMNNKIALIFQGPEEKPIYDGYLYPTILKSVYTTEEVTLYTLK